MNTPARWMLAVVVACLGNVWAQGGYTVKETRLGPIPPQGAQWCFGPNGWRFGHIAERDGKWTATVDGVEGPAYDHIAGRIVFSPGDLRYAYVAQKGDRWCVVADGQEGTEWEQIDEDSVVFSPDGKRLAYAARKAGKQYAVIDGVPSPAYEEVALEGPVFSPDSKRVGYRARLAPEGQKADEAPAPGPSEAELASILEKLPKGEKVEFSFGATGEGMGMVDAPCWAAVVDGVPGSRHASVESPVVFSPDGKRVAYAVGIENGTKRQVYVDGVAGPTLGGLEDLDDPMRDLLSPRRGPILFSPDSAHVLYVAWIEHRLMVVVDGVPTPAQGSVDVGSLQFSPDGKRVAYRGSQGGKLYAVVDGVAGPAFDCMSMGRRPWFSRDSKHVAYKAAVVKGGSWCVVLDGVAGPPFSNVFGEVEFGADGKMAYAGGQVPEGMYLVVDGVVGEKLYSVGPIGFSPDGKRMACPAAIYNVGRGLLVDGAILGGSGYDPPYWGTAEHRPVFSPDSKHVALVFRRDPRCVMVLDGVAGPEWDQIWGERFAFHEDGTLEYLAVRDKVIYNVKHVLAAGM
jgi:roadblock/LC7 domain-containing protein